MDSEQRQDHWQRAYKAKADHEVSWTQNSPEPSLALVMATASSLSSSIIDIGGGASHLVDHLLQRGYADVSVLDLSSAALAKAQARLGGPARSVDWIVADITSWHLPARTRYGTTVRRFISWSPRPTVPPT